VSTQKTAVPITTASYTVPPTDQVSGPPQVQKHHPGAEH